MVQTTDDTDQEVQRPKRPAAKSAKKTAPEIKEEQESVDPDEQDPMFITARPEGMDTPAWNSQPHPELWPSPDTDRDAEADNPDIKVVPEAPSTNFEYTIKANGLPPSSGVVFRLDWTDNTGEPTFLTHKTDPQGVAHVVWRSQHAGKNSVTILSKNDHELGKEIVSHDYDIVDPAEDKRLGEARGHA
jgi:hypothetical protein